MKNIESKNLKAAKNRTVILKVIPHKNRCCKLENNLECSLPCHINKDRHRLQHV